ncbi:MAG: hypothetical protein QOC79_2224, partial [Actinomycetota bacterium]|nr:hypothetical protein [Actinomycetota bacterium]
PQCARLSEWFGSETRPWRVDAVCGDTYIPAKSRSVSNPLVNRRAIRGSVITVFVGGDTCGRVACEHAPTSIAAVHSNAIARPRIVANATTRATDVRDIGA